MGEFFLLFPSSDGKCLLYDFRKSSDEIGGNIFELELDNLEATKKPPLLSYLKSKKKWWRKTTCTVKAEKKKMKLTSEKLFKWLYKNSDQLIMTIHFAFKYTIGFQKPMQDSKGNQL